MVFAAAAATSAKAFKAAVAAGLAVLKGGGARHLAVASALPQPVDAAQAQALAAAVGDALYVYRHTKPSRRRRRSCNASRWLWRGRTAAVREGLQRGEAIAAGVALARECANRPGNHCTPTYLADEAKRLAKDHDLKVEVLDRKEVEKLGMGSFLAVAQGSQEPLKFIVAAVPGRSQDGGAGGAGGQGHHLRHRRHLHQAGRRDGRDEVRHGRCGQRAGHLARGGAS